MAVVNKLRLVLLGMMTAGLLTQCPSGTGSGVGEMSSSQAGLSSNGLLIEMAPQDGVLWVDVTPRFEDGSPVEAVEAVTVTGSENVMPPVAGWTDFGEIGAIIESRDIVAVSSVPRSVQTITAGGGQYALGFEPQDAGEIAAITEITYLVRLEGGELKRVRWPTEFFRCPPSWDLSAPSTATEDLPCGEVIDQ